MMEVLTENVISHITGEDPCRMKKLCINKKHFKKVDIKSCKDVERIDLSKNEIVTAKGLGNCHKVTWMNMSHNKLHSLEFISKMTKLSVLNFGNNEVEDITPTSNLTDLKALIANNNCICKVVQLQRLQMLNTLVLSHNVIEEIDVSMLTSLTKLQLSHNKIKMFPNIKFNTSLKSISLNDNLIKKVPEDCIGDNRVELLDLGKNKVKQLKNIKTLASLSSLKNLNLHGNEVCMVDAYSVKVQALFPNLSICDSRPVGHSKKTSDQQIPFHEESDPDSSDDCACPRSRKKRHEEKDEVSQNTSSPKKKRKHDVIVSDNDNVLVQKECDLHSSRKGFDIPTVKDQSKVSSDQQHKNTGVKAHKTVKSGVIAIKTVKRHKGKTDNVDLFATFQSNIGSGISSTW